MLLRRPAEYVCFTRRFVEPAMERLTPINAMCKAALELQKKRKEEKKEDFQQEHWNMSSVSA